ncbi:TIGR02652 family protein [Synechococcus elongatus]|uniref:TIGR02652 family protein n=1 Tax=Synechococcus elongatus (strain ATCC 33912 / PCC 7942 / FACHB-805) TaxID=1140 RepID=Q31LS9_SYNE7|nr:TIGR02652 family protein [Synechococcus elongatus]ABB57990.1 conserved hypothetical protein [Synechococcus elongatus PCC 7942 = FACHB-805]AJD57531.1 hypothetical protein M744_06620 [Synechococcus elongatus UTEX 2973]MBD2586708.1 TIGR02652 family protein [Synechococcus elongatus FACHB-242]MBD2687781.1 TIGR02652 family protein [Synechococcus elongatus FACHB-1061]MBD2706508.1 TIGR02652 family protein [Synechococcus elongatus PCC 7942 = FACHB-805]
MVYSAAQYPLFGAEISCPHCRQNIPALTLTDAYLCNRHGAFEANPETGELVHLQSGRTWRRWEDQWHRQHTHPDGLRFEIHEALDRLFSQGQHAVRVTIADRYRELLRSYWQRSGGLGAAACSEHRIYGLPVQFSPSPKEDPCWAVINFQLESKDGALLRYPHFRLFE